MTSAWSSTSFELVNVASPAIVRSLAAPSIAILRSDVEVALDKTSDASIEAPFVIVMFAPLTSEILLNETFRTEEPLSSSAKVRAPRFARLAR